MLGADWLLPSLLHSDWLLTVMCSNVPNNARSSLVDREIIKIMISYFNAAKGQIRLKTGAPGISLFGIWKVAAHWPTGSKLALPLVAFVT